MAKAKKSKRQAVRGPVKVSDVVILTSTNLTGLGGRMGTETISTNFVKYFSSVDRAMIYAVNDLKRLIKWKTRKNGSITSGDLGHVEYGIEPLVLSG